MTPVLSIDAVYFAGDEFRNAKITRTNMGEIILAPEHMMTALEVADLLAEFQADTLKKMLIRLDENTCITLEHGGTRYAVSLPGECRYQVRDQVTIIPIQEH
jgi:hypothetical protein